MKKLLLLPLIVFLFAGTPTAQSDDTKRLQADLKADARKKSRDEKKASETKREDDFAVVASFPERFVNNTFRFKDVPVKVESIVEGGNTTYYMEFYTPKWKKYSTTPVVNGMSFVVEPEVGHGVHSFLEEYRLQEVRTHVTVSLERRGPDGQTGYIARVRCIEMLGVFGQKLKKLGACENR